MVHTSVALAHPPIAGSLYSNPEYLRVAAGYLYLRKIVTERYKQGSFIVISNRAFAGWVEVFNNDLLASAALNRLLHHTHTLIIRGDSFRQRNRTKEVLPTLPE